MNTGCTDRSPVSSSASPLFTPQGSPHLEERELENGEQIGLGGDGGSSDASRRSENLRPSKASPDAKGRPRDAECPCCIASRQAPPIPGLFYDDAFLTADEMHCVMEDVAEQRYFDMARGRDQAVLFGARAGTSRSSKGLPAWTSRLLSLLEARTRAHGLLDDEAYRLVFFQESIDDTAKPATRQCILNLYAPGQGIKAHVDIPHRFLDGIMLLSFGSGISMDFVRRAGPAPQSSDKDTALQRAPTEHSLYLAPGSLCILTGEARWEWTHGIATRDHDWVTSVRSNDAGDDDDNDPPNLIMRGQRLSITMRWLKIQQEQPSDDNSKTQQYMDEAPIAELLECDFSQAELRSEAGCPWRRPAR